MADSRSAPTRGQLTGRVSDVRSSDPPRLQATPVGHGHRSGDFSAVRATPRYPALWGTPLRLRVRVRVTRTTAADSLVTAVLQPPQAAPGPSPGHLPIPSSLSVTAFAKRTNWRASSALILAGACVACIAAFLRRLMPWSTAKVSSSRYPCV